MEGRVNWTKYIVRRLLFLVPTFIGISFLTFFISHIVPGDPARLVAGLEAPKAQVQAIREQLGLDRPVHVQYLDYMNRLLHGDLGQSVLNRRPVVENLQAYLPATAELALPAFLIAVLIGVPLGVLTAINKDGVLDNVLRVASLAGTAFPIFWVGIILLLIFYFRLEWFPGSGRVDYMLISEQKIRPVTHFLVLDSILAGNRAVFWDSLKHLVLPAITLSFARTAFTETDIYAACAFVWLLVSVSHLQDKRTLGSAGIAAVLLGLAISTKFTAVFLFPAILVHVISWSHHNSEHVNLRLRDLLGVGGLVVILFSLAWYGWNNVGFSAGAENDGVVAVMYYLLTAVWWVAILIWVVRRYDHTASPLVLVVLVLILAISTFIIYPPVHLTNPDIIQSLFNRFDNEMGLKLGFMIEAIGVHLGSVIFKSSPLVGLGLLAGVVGALLQWKRRKQVRLPLLVVSFYYLGLVSLPIAQTFYMMPLLPILAILSADQWFRLLSNSRILAILIGAAAAVVLILDLARCYPDYNLNGYQWLGPRYFLGRPTIGYRSIVQTTSDGVQQTIQWVCDNTRRNDRVVVYAYPWHIVEATCPDPPYRVSRGQWESVRTGPDYVIVHINHTIRAKWSAWFSGWENNKPADSVFWEPYDAEWLHTNFTKVFSVPRAFGLEMASVWQRNDLIDDE